MIRTQIQLQEAQARQLKEAARLEGVSMAEMIRRCIELALPTILPERATRYANARAAVGACSAGAQDLAEEHDKYLEEAFE
jgi:hypothetical protein